MRENKPKEAFENEGVKKLTMVTRVLLDVAFADNYIGSSGFVSIKFFCPDNENDLLSEAIHKTKKQMLEKGYAKHDIDKCTFKLIQKDSVEKKDAFFNSQESFVYYD